MRNRYPGVGGSLGQRYVTSFYMFARLAVNIRQIALIVKPYLCIFQRQTSIMGGLCQNERNYKRHEALQGMGSQKLKQNSVRPVPITHLQKCNHSGCSQCMVLERRNSQSTIAMSSSCLFDSRSAGALYKILRTVLVSSNNTCLRKILTQTNLQQHQTTKHENICIMLKRNSPGMSSE